MLLGLLLFLPWAGNSDASAGPKTPTGQKGQGFVDVTAALGLNYTPRSSRSGESFRPGGRMAEAGGIALVDIDRDGRLELYISHGNEAEGRLFSYDGSRFATLPGNRGIGSAGIEVAGYFIDLDQDGHLDFLSIRPDGPQTFRNDGSGRFNSVPGLLGVPHQRNTHSMAAADYDNDGDLDLFFAHWFNRWNRFKPLSHYLWRNNGRGRYEDVSHIVPIRSGFALGSSIERELSFTATFADIDADGDPDILLASDFRTSQILRNDGGKGFTDIAGHVLTDENGMGAAVADFDRDGDLDWFVTSIHEPKRRSGHNSTGNRLYLNVGGAHQFADISRLAKVREGGWGWGACAADFDNDGHPDLFHTNGWFNETTDVSMHASAELDEFVDDRSRFFMSNRDGTFSEVASAFGIDHSGQGRGVVCADYDGDGRVDIFIANHGAAPTVYANRIENANHWLQIDLVGRHSNPKTVPARCRRTGGRPNAVGQRTSGGSSRRLVPGAGACDPSFRPWPRPAGDVHRSGVARTRQAGQPDRERRGGPAYCHPSTGRHSNPQGVGARVVVRTRSGSELQEVRLGGSYLAQGPATLHFGLGRDRLATSIEVAWPGPGKQVSRIENVEVDRRIVIRQPAPEGVLLSVVRGGGGGLHAAGTRVAIEADAPAPNYRFSHWSSEGGGAFDDPRSPRTEFSMPAGPAIAVAHFLPGPPLLDRDVSAARRCKALLRNPVFGLLDRGFAASDPGRLCPPHRARSQSLSPIRCNV